ncbi:MAG TPA: hypothetical protein ENI96_06800 [Sedimenticola thiotaurini]|uniref:Uncharacterized protein n=1 Tax=Sedimenticola thiotaurini TaxID=1543721 RepID=A0A831RMH0_9GAMM|nr:hypothetical protein [Sedimenticola thiotaurini]
MTGSATKRLLVLESGLFPDRETVREALQYMEQEGICQVVHRDLTGPALDEAGWDRLLRQILGSEKVITL